MVCVLQETPDLTFVLGQDDTRKKTEGQETDFWSWKGIKDRILRKHKMDWEGREKTAQGEEFGKN